MADLAKPKRGGGIRLTIKLGSASYTGFPVWTPAQARIHLKHHPEAMLYAAEQWQSGRYVQVDIGVEQIREAWD